MTSQIINEDKRINCEDFIFILKTNVLRESTEKYTFLYDIKELIIWSDTKNKKFNHLEDIVKNPREVRKNKNC